ncbi:MAG: hypothetical protein M3256_13265 [Actinomycetota bacterium]|nr:hypothetical protein [Actinomycetota bacterium]
MTYPDVSQADFDELERVILDELKAQLAMDRAIDDIPEMIADLIVRRFHIRRRNDRGSMSGPRLV